MSEAQTLPSSNPTAAPAAADRPPTDCAAELRQRFPALFGGGYRPLKLRIQADIQQRAAGVFGKQALSAFLRRHTGSTGYLLAMTKSPHRFDLDGQPSGEVSAEHRQAAIDELARRRSVQQDKADQARQGRLARAALLADFERTTLALSNFCALKGIEPQTLDKLLATAREEGRADRERAAQARPGPERRAEDDRRRASRPPPVRTRPPRAP